MSDTEHPVRSLNSSIQWSKHDIFVVAWRKDPIFRLTNKQTEFYLDAPPSPPFTTAMCPEIHKQNVRYFYTHIHFRMGQLQTFRDSYNFMRRRRISGRMEHGIGSFF
jgi:hypothetical protein